MTFEWFSMAFRWFSVALHCFHRVLTVFTVPLVVFLVLVDFCVLRCFIVAFHDLFECFTMAGHGTRYLLAKCLPDEMYH